MPFFQPNPLEGIRQNIQSGPTFRRQGYSQPGTVQYGYPGNNSAFAPTAPTPATQPTTPTAPAAPAGPPQVQTSITPAPLYTPAMTQQASNRAFDENVIDMRTAMKQGDRPGVSRSAGSVSSALPIVGQGMLQGMQARAAIPLQDNIANEQHQMAGEIAREQEAQDLASLLARQSQIQNQAGLGLQRQNVSLLDALMGQLGGSAY